MKDADATWALVVGIDAYDHVRQLTGAVHDAVAAVGWLRRLGVPDEQILLHAAPHAGSKRAVDSLGLTYAGCARADFWPSFDILSQHSGPRLFVILAGHGLYEPGGDRVFLTQDAAAEGIVRNLGIDWYTRFLRGQAYTRQFVVMDGCLNLPYSHSKRASFVAGVEPGVALPPPRVGVLQVFCYGAAQGQRALEKDGHGLFLHHLLRTIDLDQPDENCLDVDERRGVFQLDLNRAVVDVVAPTVSKEAAAEGRLQQPGIQVLSDGPTPPVLAVAEITPPAAARVRVEVRPDAAVGDLTQLQLWADNATWRRRLPIPPEPVVRVPYESMLPVGLQVAVRCRVGPDGKWSQQEFVAEKDRDVVFELEPPPSAAQPESVVEVQTVGSLGHVVPGMTDTAYQHVATVLGEIGTGIVLEPHETGPVLRSSPHLRAWMPQVAQRIAQTINRYTDDNVSVVIRGADLGAPETAVGMPLTFDEARELAGLLMDDDVITMGEQAVAPTALVLRPTVEVDPGPVVVRIDLPWGEWVSRVDAEAGTTTSVPLPRSVGVPPLRVRLLGDRSWSFDQPRTVVALGPKACEGPVLVGDEPRGELTASTEPSETWRGPLSTAKTGADRWSAVVAVPHQGDELRFPLNEHGALGVALDGSPRAEPLSLTQSHHWDRLISSGRLDDLGPDEAESLTHDKWSAPLLGLAGAYSCFAQGSDTNLSHVLGNLEQLDDQIPDLAVIRGVMDRRTGHWDAAMRDRLIDLARRSAVPAFRWGVPWGVLAAEYYEVPELLAQLRALESGLVTGSVWTMWLTGPASTPA